jgi:hypothetical protein
MANLVKVRHECNVNGERSQLNVGAIGNVEVGSCAGVGDVTGSAPISCGTGELNTGLKAVASGLKDVVRCCSAETERSMILISLLRCNQRFADEQCQ